MAKSVSEGVSSLDQPRHRLVHAIADQRREAVSRAIEDVAIDLFASRPMADVKIEDIAATAGVAIRTLYRYFPTKEHIFAGVPRRGAERVAAAIRSRPKKESPFEALRNAFAEVAGDVEIAEVERWLQAVANSDIGDRIARMSLVVSIEALTSALADRCGTAADDLWPQMAGTMAAGALLVGTQQWAREQGALVEHQLAALDIAGEGIGHRRSTPRRRQAAKVAPK